MDLKQISIPITNYPIKADWHEGTNKNDIILTFVGFGSSKKNNSEFVANIVTSTGFSVLVVDLSGHGESPFDVNDTMPAQHILEATKTYDWIVATYPDSTIHAMGTSYGGFVAAYLTRFRPVEKLVLRTPAIYEPKDFYTAHQHIDKLAAREYRKNSNALNNHPLFLQEPISTPSTLLVVHGNDASVPTETTDVYGKKFSATSYVAEGFVHAFRDPSNPQDRVADYYSTVSNWFVK